MLRQAQGERGGITIEALPGDGGKVALVPWSATDVPAITIDVEVSRQTVRTIQLWYVLSGQIDGIKRLPLGNGQRRDGLWQTTCFELFAKPETGDDYFEFNFAPTSDWAAYAFDDYREGMIEAPALSPVITSAEINGSWSLGVELDVSSLPPPPWQISLSAVIEETDGTKSYWALRHPPGKPDFHHPDCFALRIPAVG